jgi:hypothetical protein
MAIALFAALDSWASADTARFPFIFNALSILRYLSPGQRPIAPTPVNRDPPARPGEGAELDSVQALDLYLDIAVSFTARHGLGSYDA